MEISHIIKTYGITAEIAEQVLIAKANLNTEAGYVAYYNVFKAVTDAHLPFDVLFDLSANFAWDDRLDNAVNRLALADGRPDLANPT